MASKTAFRVAISLVCPLPSPVEVLIKVPSRVVSELPISALKAVLAAGVMFKSMISTLSLSVGVPTIFCCGAAWAKLSPKSAQKALKNNFLIAYPYQVTDFLSPVLLMVCSSSQ